MKKSKNNESLFEFDLEKSLQDEKQNEELLKHAEEQIHALKNTLRTGSDKAVFEDLGILLNGYSSLHKVLTKAARNVNI